MPLLFIPNVKKQVSNVYWAQNLLYSGTRLQPLAIRTVPGQNVYSLHNYTNTIAVLVCTDKDGNIQWQRQITTSVAVNAQNLWVDYTNNALYVTCRSSVGSSVNSSGIAAINLFKYNLSGSLIWSYVYGAGATASNSLGLTVDPSGNVLMYAYVSASVSDLVKISGADGSLLWQKHLTASGTNGWVRTDPSSYVFTAVSDGAGTIALVKTDSSGVFQWARKIYVGASILLNVTGLDIDASGYTFLLFTYNPSGLANSSLYLEKFDPSGNLVWQLIIHGNGGNDTTSGSMIIGADNNIYITLSQSNSYTPIIGYISIISLDPDGNVNYKYSVKTNTTTTNMGVYTLTGVAPSIGPNSGIYVAASMYVNSITSFFILRLPEASKIMSTSDSLWATIAISPNVVITAPTSTSTFVSTWAGFALTAPSPALAKANSVLSDGGSSITSSINFLN